MLPQGIFGELPALETDRLLLRKMTMEDAADMFEYASNPDVAKFTTWRAHKSVEDSELFLRAVMDEYRKHEPSSWGIEEKFERKLIGTCGFANWSPSDFRGEIGYALSRKYWGKGYMTEAVRAAIDFGFRTLQLNRIEARCEIKNIASARVMEKAGMRFEGILRQHAFYKGAFRDLKMYSILRKEWVE
ncbi:MAG: GNAT family N-acetyltransferase [Oscillatoria princeps RMCB-10]|jgi:ribosomal-protein-alanine N-acetyltransferase|nr:GNAT family N-acetyltransferase [Oscillatoria princeps RMCB-10]